MTVISQSKDSISIKGHAGYGEPGKDIVCAGISTLAQNLIASIEELTEDEIHYIIKPGTVDIKHGTLSREAQLLVKSFFIGIQMIADEFPENVRIV